MHSYCEKYAQKCQYAYYSILHDTMLYYTILNLKPQRGSRDVLLIDVLTVLNQML